MSVDAPPQTSGVIVLAGSDADRTLAALAFAASIAREAHRDIPLFVIPTVRTRWRWLYPFANWRALRLARRLRRRGAVATVPS